MIRYLIFLSDKSRVASQRYLTSLASLASPAIGHVSIDSNTPLHVDTGRLKLAWQSHQPPSPFISHLHEQKRGYSAQSTATSTQLIYEGLPLVVPEDKMSEQSTTNVDEDIESFSSYEQVLEAIKTSQESGIMMQALLKIINLDKEFKKKTNISFIIDGNDSKPQHQNDESRSIFSPSPLSDPSRTQAISLLSSYYLQLVTSLEVGTETSPCKYSVDFLFRFMELGTHPGKDGGALGLLELSRLLLDKVLPLLEKEPPGYMVKLLFALYKANTKFERVQVEQEGLGFSSVEPELFKKASTFLLPRIHSLDSSQLTMLVTAMAANKELGHEALHVICGTSMSRLAEFKLGNLVGIIKALAGLRYQHDSFYDKVAKTLVSSHIKNMDSRHITSLTKSFSELKFNNQEFYDACSSRLQVSMSTLGAQQVTDVAWSYAVRGIEDMQLYSSLAFQANELPNKQFSPSIISKLIFSYGKQNMTEPKLLKKSEDIVLGLLENDVGKWQFQIRNITNLLYGYAKLNHSSERLISSLAERVYFLLDDTECRAMIRRSENSTEAIKVKVEEYFDSRGRKVTRRIEEASLKETVELTDGSKATRSLTAGSPEPALIPQNLSDLAWSLSTLGCKDEKLFDRIAKRAEERIQEFKKTSLVDIAFAFVTAKNYNASLFDSIMVSTSRSPLLPPRLRPLIDLSFTLPNRRLVLPAQSLISALPT